MYKIKYFIVIGVIVSWVLAACQNPVEHTAPAIHNRDSVAMMTSYGVNTSSVIRVSSSTASLPSDGR